MWKYSYEAKLSCVRVDLHSRVSAAIREMAMLIQRWGTTAKRLLLTAEQRYAFTSLSPSSTSTAPAPSPVLCGRGDKRTKKGKIFKGSYGNSRPKKEKKIQRIKDKLEVPRSTPWPLPFKLIWFLFCSPIWIFEYDLNFQEL